MINIKSTNLRYICYFTCVLVVIGVVYTSISSYRISKKIKKLDGYVQEAINKNNKVELAEDAVNAVNERHNENCALASGIIEKAINVASNNSCELFSSAVGICDNECTETSCESISRETFLNLISPEQNVLEIGPYVNPIFRGKNVKYFDIMNADEMRKQVLSEKNAGIRNNATNDSVSRIPDIDYVHPTGDLSVIKEKFDAVFSSHNIEHQIDLVTHLNQVANLLKSGGTFYLIVPDKRYCFDHFIPESPLSDIIDNYYSGPKKNHPLKMILAMDCETTHNDAALHWKGDHGYIKGKDYKCYSDALKAFAGKKGEYINAHRWRFTPQQFEFIMNELYKMGLISLKVDKVYVTQENTQEFKAILYKP